MRANPKYAANPKLLQAHPVLGRLLTLKQAMASLERLDFGPNSDDEENGGEYDDDEDMFSFWKGDDLVDMDEDEYAELLREAREINGSPPKKGKSIKSNGVKEAHSPSKSKEDKPEKTSRKKKKEKKKKLVFDLEEPEFVPVGKSKGHGSKSAKTPELTPFGEYTSLDAVDAMDKQARKKSLRFHTSRIESASSRREKVRGGAIGGDDDIPYREREREKEARLKKQTEKQRGKGGEDLEDVSMEDVHIGKKRPREEGSDAEMDVDGYYDLVKRQKKERKTEKQVKYDADKATEKYVIRV
jgi:U3 small nucleolar RNA-associated protein 3